MSRYFRKMYKTGGKSVFIFLANLKNPTNKNLKRMARIDG